MNENIKTRAARNKLQPRREPYWERLELGLHLGYRVLKDGTGTWIARRTVEAKKTFSALGALDDFDDARRAALAWAGKVDAGISTAPLTVADACKHYVDAKRVESGPGPANDAEGRFKRLVYAATLGSIRLDKLTSKDLTAWRNAQATGENEESVRRAKDSCNRNLTALKAALNRAHKDRLIDSDSAWKHVTAFPAVGRRRDGYLTFEQRQALLSHCSPSLRELVKGLLLTALRPGELAALRVKDFDRSRGVLALQRSKVELRDVALSTAAIVHFGELCKARIADAPLVSDDTGKAWHKDAWKRPFKLAAEHAGLPDASVMYDLRHTAISDLISGGMNIHAVAATAGTSIGIIEKHYGHLRPEVVRAAMDLVKLA